MATRRITRRAALGCGAAAVAGVTVACRTGSDPAWRYFTAEEARTVDAVCEQLIPADKDPGARDAGVVNFIDIQLATRLRRYRKVYREGIVQVDANSRKKFGKRFTDLSSEQQVEILNDLEENSKVFFELILAHTRQGFYGDPRHGGNRNRVSWKMVGLPYPPVRGRQRYEEPKVG